MCGILAVFGAVDDALLSQATAASERLSHRGPDGHGVHYQQGRGALIHRRLAIMDPASGRQPLFGRDGGALVHNGEIYNHAALRARLQAAGRVFRSGSDSEVLVHLYEARGDAFVAELDGVFALAAMRDDDWVVARDPIGVKPLYYGRDLAGNLWFSSELKALVDRCAWFKVFPPGHIYTGRGGLRRWYERTWLEGQSDYRRDAAGLRERFEAAVDKRLMSDVPLGVLLSGGLDSSLVAALAARLARRRDPGARLQSFAIGVDGDSPDLRAAREVAAFIGTEHHEVRLDLDDGVEALRAIIWHTESYDIPTVRASVPMYRLSRYIRDQGVKVVLSGEGSDEVFGGYLYFYFAEGEDAFQRETVERVKNLHFSDVLRADKSTMAHGVEARVPFLDLAFLDLAMTIDPALKRPLAPGADREGRMEKALLRAAFADPADPLLPPAVLWRQKEQFSDGVGYGWVERLKAHAEATVSDLELAEAGERFPHETPTTKEGYLYRALFSSLFPGDHAARCVRRWVPRWQADADSSGRANPLHASAVRKAR
ncbi:asparagine synthase B [Nannocystis sp. ILAH1]|uniref:asparagine synthase B n=1 Tax=unclassified Nannocystis TaxID=2627009 RepID=UPI002270B64D|nr:MULTISPECIES: asparagine synthase B [unclassified Nannocystis]MCY0993517.1 asparagine synthase B [Nannocystis sp. ILAH1]MCY1063755.1 asparagine synthase B [Nannocystis sp. RBIL2]